GSAPARDRPADARAETQAVWAEVRIPLYLWSPTQIPAASATRTSSATTAVEPFFGGGETTGALSGAALGGLFAGGAGAGAFARAAITGSSGAAGSASRTSGDTFGGWSFGSVSSRAARLPSSNDWEGSGLRDTGPSSSAQLLMSSKPSL